MTIASEITRLQNDKAAICTAIENKGVTVWAVTLDDYAACIDAISSWGGKHIEYLMIAGWGWGWGGSSWSNKCWPGWWGGAWWVMSWDFIVTWNTLCVTVWCWWTRWGVGAIWWTWGNSCILDTCSLYYKEAHGGGWGGTANATPMAIGQNGGSWWWGGVTQYSWCFITWGKACGCLWEMGRSWWAYLGNTTCNCTVAGWWGWATSSWINNNNFSGMSCCCCAAPWRWWLWLVWTWWWKTLCYAGWWGGGTRTCTNLHFWLGSTWGWNGGDCTSCNGTAATTCGSWWWGGAYVCSAKIWCWWKGWGWIVIIWYNCECKDCNWFTCATWGDECYVCDSIKYHCFTSDGTFTIVS